MMTESKIKGILASGNSVDNIVSASWQSSLVGT